MRHGFTIGASTAGPSGWALTLIGLVALALIAAGIFALVRRRRIEELAGLTNAQELILEEFDAQVRALLTQHGGRMTQTEIQRALDLPADIVARKLREMEEELLVDRRWQSDEYTFEVTTS
jgi:uncharacterized membrane protein